MRAERAAPCLSAPLQLGLFGDKKFTSYEEVLRFFSSQVGRVQGCVGSCTSGLPAGSLDCSGMLYAVYNRGSALQPLRSGHALVQGGTGHPLAPA